MDLQKKDPNVDVLPNPLSIGKFDVFIDSNFDGNVKDLKNDYIENIFLVSDGDSHDFSKDGVIVINSSESERLKKKVILPNWFNENNLEHILSGNYMEILPVTAEFVTTLNCNFRCKQCSYDLPKEKNGLWMKDSRASTNEFSNVINQNFHMTRETMEKAIDELHAAGVKNILFTGGGEPLMNPMTILGMQRVKLNGDTPALYTNGRLLSSKKIENILDINPLFVRISVYGGDEKTVSNYTRVGEDKKTYEKVIANIRELAFQKMERGSDTNIGLSYLVHPITAEGIENFSETILGFSSTELEQLDYIRFTPAVDYFYEKQHGQSFMEGVFKNLEEKIVPKLEDAGVKIKLFSHRVNDLNILKSYDDCRASGWFAEVAPSGELYLCCEKHFMPEYKIGDLRTQSMAEIWNSDLRNHVIETVNSSNCSNCPTLCKPHELNKVFGRIEDFRNQGNMSQILDWVKATADYGRKTNFCPGRLDDFQS